MKLNIEATESSAAVGKLFNSTVNIYNAMEEVMTDQPLNSPNKPSGLKPKDQRV